MTDGWHGEHYLILFDPSDRAALTSRYQIDQVLSGCRLIGLLDWDDFIIERQPGELLTVPTVPLDPTHLTPIPFAIDPRRLQPDARFNGRIKWYVKPLIFGGDPGARDNINWVTLDQHVDAVKWWNQLYRSMPRSS